MSVECKACLGCGQVAGGDDDRSPWSMWESLPAGSRLAIVLGMVWPETCETCDGTGQVAAAR